jgi:hypothetical protein
MSGTKKRPAKKRLGRPPKPNARMGSPLLVRLSDAERAELQAAADRAGQPISVWARDQMLRAAR